MDSEEVEGIGPSKNEKKRRVDVAPMQQAMAALEARHHAQFLSHIQEWF